MTKIVCAAAFLALLACAGVVLAVKWANVVGLIRVAHRAPTHLYPAVWVHELDRASEGRLVFEVRQGGWT